MKPPFDRKCRKGITLKPVALAVTLALPNASLFAASLKDVVSPRADQSITERYGRDSVYAMSPHAKGQTSGQRLTDQGVLSTKGKAYSAAAFQRRGSLGPHPSTNTADTLLENQPQLYGRAGGYIGRERVAIVRRSSLPLTSTTFPDRQVLRIGVEAWTKVEAQRAAVHPYRRESAAGYDEEVNWESPPANERESQSVADRSPISRTI